MKVRHSPRQSIFDFPELANPGLVQKLNKSSEPDVGFHVKIGRFTFMTSTHGGSVRYSLVDIPEGTDFWFVQQAYKHMLSALGTNIEKEPASIYDVGLYTPTHYSDKQKIIEKILADKRVKMKIGKKPFEFNKEELLIGKVENSKENYIIRSQLQVDKDREGLVSPYTFSVQIYGESSRTKNVKGRFKDLEILDDVLSDACLSD